MGYKFTQHALDVIVEREIRIEWVEQVLEHPERVVLDKEDGTIEHRFGKIAARENRVLRVVVNTHVDPLQVVTVYFDRTLRGKL